MWSFLMSDAMRDRIKREKQLYFEEVIIPEALDWDEDRTKFSGQLCLHGESFQPIKMFNVAPIKPGEHYVYHQKAAVSPCGRFMYCIRLLPRGESLPLNAGRRCGNVYFTTDVEVPILSEVLEDNKSTRVWMSLTPFEMMSQRKGINLATGKVMVGGLGMGWFLQKVAAKPSVTAVVLVEQDAGLLDWMLPRVRELWPHVVDKLTDVIVDDAMEHVGVHGDGTRYLLDIWSKYGDAWHDNVFQGCKNDVEHLWGWGDVSLGSN